MAFYGYIHCRPDGTPFYVGKGDDRRLRRVHRANNPHHANIVKKYGAGSILVGSLECSRESIAFDLERGLIKRLRAMGLEITNMTDGGEGVSGFVMSDEAKERMRAKKIGRKLSEEHKAKIGLSQTGKRMSAESKAKTSAARKGMKFSPEHIEKLRLAKIGRKISDLQKAKLSQAILGRCWITDGVDSKMIKESQSLPDGWRFGRPPRRKK